MYYIYQQVVLSTRFVDDSLILHHGQTFARDRNMGSKYLQDVELYNTRFALPAPGKAALLVIDMQQYSALLADLIIERVRSLIDACRSAGVQIFYTRHGHHDPAKNGGSLVKWWGQAIHYGSPGWEIVSELKPRKEEAIIDKNRYSAFYGTNLDALLKEREIEDLIICGLLTNCCCETTARDAFMRDYRVFFIADATAAVAEELHIAALKNLAYGFAHILDTASLCRHLQSFSLHRDEKT
jgi:nicotinamidase-related amidase